jgi:hypothetical protein
MRTRIMNQLQAVAMNEDKPIYLEAVVISLHKNGAFFH